MKSLPATGMVLDFGKKFGDDLCALICRSIDIMRVGGLPQAQTVNIMLSVMSCQMIAVLQSSGEDAKEALEYIQTSIDKYGKLPNGR